MNITKWERIVLDIILKKENKYKCEVLEGNYEKHRV